MKRFVVQRVFLMLLMLLSLPIAHAQSQPGTSLGAAGTNLTSSVVQGLSTWALSALTTFGTETLMDHTLVNRPLTQQEADLLLSEANLAAESDLRLRNWGTRIFFEFDSDQAINMGSVRNGNAISNFYMNLSNGSQDLTSEVHPSSQPLPAPPTSSASPAWFPGPHPPTPPAFNPTTYKPNYTISSLSVLTKADLKANLNQMVLDGVSVRRVFTRGILVRAGMRMAGTLQAILLTGTFSNAGFAAYYAYRGSLPGTDTWQSERCTQMKQQESNPQVSVQTACEKPSLLSFWLNTSNAVYYHFTPAQHE